MATRAFALAVVVLLGSADGLGSGNERVASQVRLVGDARVSELLAKGKSQECARLLASGLAPVPEGKLEELDEVHRQYVARIRLLRLLLRTDKTLPVEQSNSKYRELFPGGGVRSFWLWMSRDIYVFPSIEDQEKLIGQWRIAANETKALALDDGIDINDWWF